MKHRILETILEHVSKHPTKEHSSRDLFAQLQIGTYTETVKAIAELERLGFLRWRRVLVPIAAPVKATRVEFRYRVGT